MAAALPGKTAAARAFTLTLVAVLVAPTHNGDMCARDADDFYAWASTDARVAGVLTWNYGGCATCNGSHWTPPHTCCMDEIGTKDMPKAIAAWEAVGRKLIGA